MGLLNRMMISMGASIRFTTSLCMVDRDRK